MTRFALGDDDQTIHRDGQMMAMGCSPQSARELVDRLNSEPARQGDVDLLLWLLAEQRENVKWWVQMSKIWKRETEQLEEQRDTARTEAAFWSTASGGDR